jgi:hypothetical protein
MNSKIFSSFRNLAGIAFLVAGCGAEPIPVDLATAAGPCDYGKEFVTEGMQMVMREGQLTVEPKDDGRMQAAFLGLPIITDGTTMAGCAGCH